MARSKSCTSSGWLSDHHQVGLSRLPRGFTIVELLIVIVVIAILAAITIVAYNGITSRAIETSLQSDLRNAATTLELDNTRTGSYPADAASANGGQGLKASGDNALSYVEKPYGYCASATNPRSGKTFVVKSSTGQITEGSCETTVSTLAGSGSAGFANGTGTAAQFSSPSGVAVDAAGNVYVADSNNHRIRKISAAGVVSTLAGSGSAGYGDGTGTAARFDSPSGVAVDTSGNVYVADSNNHRIRKITPAGVVSTLAGDGTSAFADGTGTAARFTWPYGVAVDATGTVYVADTNGNRIRKITSAGVVTTLAGSGSGGYSDGSGTAASFNRPYGVAVTAAGTVYVADTDNHRIRRITPGGTVTTLAGSGASGYVDGTGTAAQFYWSDGIGVDAWGNVYVADTGNARIRTISSTALVTTLAPSTSFNYPDGVAIDAAGTVYVADMDNHRIIKITQ